MTVLHKLSSDDIEAVCGDKIAKSIIAARDGQISIAEGRRRKLRPSKTWVVIFCSNL